MISRSVGVAAASACALICGPASAQDSDWVYTVTPYVWVPSLNTNIGTAVGEITADSSSRDTLDSLDFAFMGTINAQNGRWSVLADLIYADLSTSKDTPFGRLFEEAKVEVQLSAFSGYVGYRVLEASQGSIDLLGGFRAYDLDMTLSLSPGTRPGRKTSLTDNWVDPLVGARGAYAFNDRWSVEAGFDVGGTDRDSNFTWQALATLGYEINEHWSARGGWRYLDIEKSIDGQDVTVELNGPVIGLAYRF
ncbi:outer membrane protein [Pseudoruegeria sp. SK021]|uniref:outer membrane protein n=1 Tax=Pseudoruegeria sp. SK021 TaxID=1933035 RepID=UPI000A23E1E3|nr:outer membrane beta-barrel protein [Pseudoruegeria sp. SK021]OSP55911.1 hypothetical protein BV911_04475 [Pseudoruegeria sp. SK021]